MRCSVLQCVAVCCNVLQCVALCCSVLQCVAVCCNMYMLNIQRQTQNVSIRCTCVYHTCSVVYMCCSALQCVAVCCSALQCVAVCCSALQYIIRVVSSTCVYQMFIQTHETESLLHCSISSVSDGWCRRERGGGGGGGRGGEMGGGGQSVRNHRRTWSVCAKMYM